MKWRLSSPPGHEGGRVLWARGGRFLLYRVLPHLAGRLHVAGIKAKICVSTTPGWAGMPYYRVRTYRTVYGARMAAEADARRRGAGDGR